MAARRAGKGAKTRTLQTHGGPTRTLERSHGSRPVCSAGLSPLDGELARVPGSPTPRLHEALVRLSATQRSLAKAMAELAFFTGASIHLDTAHRRSEAAGALLLVEETAEANHILSEHPAAPPGPEMLAFSVDGAMALLRGRQKNTPDGIEAQVMVL